jgi:hypothetical protein
MFLFVVIYAWRYCLSGPLVETVIMHSEEFKFTGSKWFPNGGLVMIPLATVS